MQRLAERTEAATQEADGAREATWSVRLSTGYALAPAADEGALVDLFVRADATMYVNKRRRKARG